MEWPTQFFSNKAFRHVEIFFIQRFLFIHPRFVFIVQGYGCTIIQTLDEYIFEEV